MGFRTECPYAVSSENTFVPVSIFKYLGAHLQCHGPYSEQEFSDDEMMNAGPGETARRGVARSNEVEKGRRVDEEKQMRANEVERRASYEGCD